jgi:hypothetical protein
MRYYAVKKFDLALASGGSVLLNCGFDAGKSSNGDSGLFY